MSNLISLVFIGAGPFSEQVEIVRDINHAEPAYDVLGILDDDENLSGSTVEGTPVLGGLTDANKFQEVKFVLGIGTNKSRESLPNVIAKLNLPQERYETLIHPMAKIYSSADIGAGSIIHAGCIIGNDAKLGPFCKVIWNAVVGANNLIGQGTSICPNATTCSGVKIGPYSFLASAVSVSDEVTIGPMSHIGMGSNVTRDVPGGASVFGNPAKVLNKMPVPEKISAEWQKTLASCG